MLPTLLAAAPDLGAPLPVIIAIVVLVVGLLFVRFIIKTTFTLLKIALLVAIGVATWIGLSYLVGS